MQRSDHHRGGRAADTTFGAGPLTAVSSFSLLSSLGIYEVGFRGEASIICSLSLLLVAPFYLCCAISIY